MAKQADIVYTIPAIKGTPEQQRYHGRRPHSSEISSEFDNSINVQSRVDYSTQNSSDARSRMTEQSKSRADLERMFDQTPTQEQIEKMHTEISAYLDQEGVLLDNYRGAYIGDN